MIQDREERAKTILNAVKGMKICDAQRLLSQCSEQLLHQPSCGWGEPQETKEGAHD